MTTLELLRADVNGDGYVSVDDVTAITNYVNKVTNSFTAGTSFTHMCLTVDNQVGRWDGYYDCLDGYVRLVDGYAGQKLPLSSLDASQILYDGYEQSVNISLIAAYQTIPYVQTQYRIKPLPFWQPWLIKSIASTRKVLAAFTQTNAIQHPDCAASTIVCTDTADLVPSVDPGRVDHYVPGNLIVGDGEILRPDQTPYPIDMEIGIVILHLPTNQIDKKSLNIFEKFVSDAGLKLTVTGDPAMKYSDCSTVQPADLSAGKVRFSISIQSYVPAKDGYDSDGYFILDNDLIGCNIDATTGILTVSASDLQSDPIYSNLISKIQIEVYLKKAGWKNQVRTISPSQTLGLFS